MALRGDSALREDSERELSGDDAAAAVEARGSGGAAVARPVARLLRTEALLLRMQGELRGGAQGGGKAAEQGGARSSWEETVSRRRGGGYEE